MRTLGARRTVAPVSITHPPRPTFFQRRTLEWLGAPRRAEALAPAGTDLCDTIRTGRVLEASGPLTVAIARVIQESQRSRPIPVAEGPIRR
jgi:hypothetical protein